MIGSSPHTWGIRHSGLMRTKHSPVHPHIRGIYGHGPGEGQCPIRFIPTYVGYTFVTSATAPANPVHPHIRGVYTACLGLSAPGRGSSPHTWGIPVQFRVPKARIRFIPTYVGYTDSVFLTGEFCVRFIPTYVGYTVRVGRSFNDRPVHPHIRGAYACPTAPRRRCPRFIPTYVGHTRTGYS